MSDFSWRHMGAWQGGAVHSLALSFEARPTQNLIALAATDAGVFRSADSGRTWKRCLEGGRDLAYAAAHVVAFAALEARIAFAASREGGLYRSQNAGASWQRLRGWSFGPINTLAFSPNFVADATLFATTPDGIYRSQDGGRGWQSANFGLLDDDILCLACAPDFASSEVVWAGSAAGGAYRSRNAGRAWRESGEGLADSAMQSMAYAGSTLFAGTEGAGVFRLTSGTHWEACGLEGLMVNSLAACESRIWAGTDAGVFCLEEEGRTWHCALADDNVLTLTSGPNGRVIASGIATGVQASTDGGRTWQCGEGVAAHVPPLAALAPNGALGALFMFDVAGNAVCSREGGVTWEEIALSDGPIVCAATGGTAEQPAVWAVTERAVLRWQAEAGVFEPLAHQPALPHDDAICALTATPEGTLLLGTRAGSVAVLAGGGAMWHTLPVPGVHTISTMQLTPTGSLFVVCLVPADSVNASATSFNAEVWHLPTLVLPMAQPSEEWSMVVALDSLHAPLACMTIVNTAEGETVVLAGQNMIAVASLVTGQVHTATLPDGTAITAMIAVQRGLLAGTNRGVFSSAKDGRMWQPCALELGDAPVVALLADEQIVCAITLGGDVWQGV